MDEGVEERRQELNEISRRVIGAAISVHRELGPGLLESAYEACLAHELTTLGMRIERQKALPVVYRGVRLDCGYRLDLVAEEKVLVELKAVEKIDKIHEAQLMSYLKLSGCKLGLLINFNVRVLKDGIHRIVNNF
jgi:GxxExxY protein